MKLSSPSQVYFVKPLYSVQPLSNVENKEPTKPIVELKLPEPQSQLSLRAQRCKEIQARMLSNRNILKAESENQIVQQRNIF